MKVILACCVISLAIQDLQAAQKCEGYGRAVKQFNGRKEEVQIPCKYHAINQRCGKYFVNLTPGNLYLYPKYRLNSLWLGLEDVDSGKRWEGRTDNKLSIKFFNGWRDELFTKKEGGLRTENVLRFRKNNERTWAEAKNGDFRVTFYPWDPENRAFRMSKWRFECFRDMESVEYPEQICGGENRRAVVEREEKLGLKTRQQVIILDVFNSSTIAQSDPKCHEASRLMTDECTDRQRLAAVTACGQILSSSKHTQCVTKYTCDPMDVFVDCIAWVCSNYKDDAACERIGRSIDLCRDFQDGNLTALVKKENCYKDFISIK